MASDIRMRDGTALDVAVVDYLGETLAKKLVGQPANPFHSGEVLLKDFLVPGKLNKLHLSYG